jgi:hypothetical protein
MCKFWLEPIALSKNSGFAPKELNAIRRIIEANLTQILEAWHEHCGEDRWTSRDEHRSQRRGDHRASGRRTDDQRTVGLVMALIGGYPGAAITL